MAGMDFETEMTVAGASNEISANIWSTVVACIVPAEQVSKAGNLCLRVFHLDSRFDRPVSDRLAIAFGSPDFE